jgi:hypothetical protein
MSDEDDDLFADSDSGGDTDDLIAESKSKPIAKPKKIVKKINNSGQKRKRVPGMYYLFVLVFVRFVCFIIFQRLAFSNIIDILVFLCLSWKMLIMTVTMTMAVDCLILTMTIAVERNPPPQNHHQKRKSYQDVNVWKPCRPKNDPK